MLLTVGTKMTIQLKVTQEDPMEGYYDLSIIKCEWRCQLKLVGILNNK